MTVLGAVEEVGRAGILVETEETKILLDYGVLINEEIGFPWHVRPKEVDAIVLSHAHLDHSGAIPLFHITRRVPVCLTKTTKELTDILLKDFIKVSGHLLPYELIDVKAMLKSCVISKYNSWIRIKDCEIKLVRAGHIPGSAQIVVKTPDKTLLYTGDINFIDTKLMRRADDVLDKVDLAIVESTYGGTQHPDRNELERRFIDKIEEVLERGGRVLVPSFAVGRSQEILCILEDAHLDCDIYLDGMARRVSIVLERYGREDLRDPELYKRALRSADWIGGKRDRKKALKRSGVIVSPAGMLKGGPSVFYAKRIATDENSAILLVSYQIEGTPGRLLMEERKLFIDGNEVPVEAEVELYHFSSHCDGEQMARYVRRRIPKEAQVLVVHGEKEQVDGLCKRLQEAGYQAYSPPLGEALSA